MGEERDEEYRILANLSRRVREEMQTLWSNYEILGELDFLYAISKLSIRLKSVRPQVNEDGEIDLREARHPLLIFQKGDQVVPVHLRLGNGIRTLIISGANAGGKTVSA